jgi:Protein of unknown function (DUF3800)
MLRVMLPDGGYAMIECQAFFDESASHEGAPFLCLAGYIFHKSHAIKLGHEWKKVLRWKKLPYFRMSECAHGNGPFANLTRAERIAVATRMIEIIKARAVQGIAVTIDNLEFVSAAAEYPQLSRIYGTPYSFVTHSILAGVACWLIVNPHVHSMAYFFESGHGSEPQSNRIMERLFAPDARGEAYRYSGHGFVPKQKSAAIQAADLLAWQWYKDRKSKSEGRPRRKDCASLFQLHHTAVHLDRPGIVSILTNDAGIPEGFRPVVVSRARSS